MKNKLVVLSLFTAIFAVGCSESAYTPNTGLPANNTGIYNPTTGYPNNSGFQNNYQNLAFQNPQLMNQMYPMYQQQNMLSWSFRAQIPGFYYGPVYRNCVQRQSYYTTCSRRVVRRTCAYNYNRNTVSTTPTANTASNDVVSSSSNNTANTDVANTTPTTPVTNTTSNNTANADTAPTTDKTLVVAVSVQGDVAKALYERLAKTEETMEKDRLFNAGIKARTGANYKCIVDGKKSRAKNYVCDLDIRAVDGIVLDQKAGQDGAPEITSSSMYKGDILNIGVPGEAPEVGYLTITGTSAADLNKNLPVEAIAGKVAEAGNVDAMIKTLGQVKCYTSTNTQSAETECVIKIESNTGKVLSI